MTFAILAKLFIMCHIFGKGLVGVLTDPDEKDVVKYFDNLLIL